MVMFRTILRLKKLYCMLAKPRICSKCTLILEGHQVQCDFCLDLYHFKCVQDPFSKLSLFVLPVNT